MVKMGLRINTPLTNEKSPKKKRDKTVLIFYYILKYIGIKEQIKLTSRIISGEVNDIPYRNMNTHTC